MTNQEFNEKYKNYLEKGWGGMEAGNSKLIDWFDKLFTSILIKENKDFKYQQIKIKFGYVIFYSSLRRNQQKIIESTANKVYNENNKNR